MGYAGNGWIKMWRSAVQADMDLTPHEFKFWVLLQAIVLHAATRTLARGSVELSYSDIRLTLRGSDPQATSYSYSTLSHALTKLAETGRIERLSPGRGNRVRVRIKEWDLLQHGRYDVVPGRTKTGWFKIWRWAVLYEDMDLSPEEFKLWYLLLSMACHDNSDDAKRVRGTVRTTLVGLRTPLGDVVYTEQNLLRVLDRLENTGRIERLGDGTGNVLRVSIRDWDLMQHGDYHASRWDSL